MATRTATISNPSEFLYDGEGWQIVTWTGLLNGDDGSPIDMGAYADRSVQVFGTFGTGGNCRIEGSNDGGTTWATLSGTGGVALDVTSAKVTTVVDLAWKLRPRVTAGDGTTSLTVALFVRKGFR